MRKLGLCTAINHPWELRTPILIMKNGSRRCYLECPRCGSVRVDMRSPNGRITRSKSYKHSEEYQEFLTETRSRNRRAAMWSEIVGEAKEKPYSEKNHPHLRLLQAPRARGQNR